MTSEERIEKVKQFLMEEMTDEKKSKENYLRPNSKGQFIKDNFCVSNCLEALNRS